MTVAFQFDEDEDFALAGSALTLVGIIHSTPDELDRRYRVGMSRLFSALENIEETSVWLSDLIEYLILTAHQNQLPLLEAARVFAAQQGIPVSSDLRIFSMEGDAQSFMAGFRLPGEAGKVLKTSLASGDLEEADDLLKNIFVLRAHMLRRHSYGRVIEVLGTKRRRPSQKCRISERFSG